MIRLVETFNVVEMALLKERTGTPIVPSLHPGTGDWQIARREAPRLSIFRVPGRVWLVTIPYGLAFSAIAAEQQYLVAYLLSRGVAPLVASLALAAIYLSGSVVRLFVGLIDRRLGMKRTMLIGLAWYVIFPLITLVTLHSAALVANAAIWGLAAAMAWTAGYAQVLNAAGAGRYGAGTGLFNSSIGITQAVAVVYWGGPVAAGGYPRLLIFSAVVAAAGWVAAALIGGAPSPVQDAAASAGPAVKPGLLPRRLSLSVAAVGLFLSFAGSFAWGIVLNNLNHYIAATFGAALVGLTVGLFYVATLLFPFVSGILSDWLGRRGLLAAGFLAGALAMAGAATQLWLLAAAGTFLLGLQNATVRTVLTAWIGDVTDADERTGALGVLGGVSTLGTATAILVGGALGAQHFMWGFAIFGGFFVVCAGLCGLLSEPRAHKAELSRGATPA